VKGEGVLGLVARADTVPAALLHELAGTTPGLRFVEGATHDALAVSRAALVKSGTSTVEAALIGTPFVVLYKVAPLTYRLARLLVRGVRHIAMVNVLAGREVVPERIQDEAEGELLARDLLALWEGERRERMERELAKVARSLGEPGATERLAAWMVERFGGGEP
jgi:lipid-A-disaccharide synthase